MADDRPNSIEATDRLRECIDGFGLSPTLTNTWRHGRQMALVELAALRAAADTLFSETEAYPGFVELYALAKAADPQHLASVMGSPYSFVWLKRLFDLIKAQRGEIPFDEISPHMAAGQNVTDYLNELLDRFGLLVTGALVNQRSTYAFAHPVRICRPSTLPATSIHLAPERRGGLITGVVEGRVVLKGASTVELDTITVGGRRIVIDPFDELLFVEAREGASKECGRVSASTFGKIVLSAVELLQAKCPAILDEIALAYYAISPSLIASPSGFPSGTTSTSIGLSCFSLPPSPLVLCEMLVHEVSHAHLFAFQNIDPLLDPSRHGEGWMPQDLYSPWRDDARPVNGVLHGAFVFTRVANMWLHFLKNDGTADDLALRRLAALRHQLAISQAILADNAAWTPIGAEFFSVLSTRIRRIKNECKALPLSTIEPIYAEVASLGRSSGSAAVRQTEHLNRWRLRHPQLCASAERAVCSALAS